MLHLISQSPIDLSILERVETDDDIIFLDKAIIWLNKNSTLSSVLEALLNNNVFLYALEIELETKGIQQDDLVAQIKVIDYSGFVALTEKNQLIHSWN